MEAEGRPEAQAFRPAENADNMAGFSRGNFGHGASRVSSRNEVRTPFRGSELPAPSLKAFATKTNVSSFIHCTLNSDAARAYAFCSGVREGCSSMNL